MTLKDFLLPDRIDRKRAIQAMIAIINRWIQELVPIDEETPGVTPILDDMRETARKLQTYLEP